MRRNESGQKEKERKGEQAFFELNHLPPTVSRSFSNAMQVPKGIVGSSYLKVYTHLNMLR